VKRAAGAVRLAAMGHGLGSAWRAEWEIGVVRHQHGAGDQATVRCWRRREWIGIGDTGGVFGCVPPPVWMLSG